MINANPVKVPNEPTRAGWIVKFIDRSIRRVFPSLSLFNCITETNKQKRQAAPLEGDNFRLFRGVVPPPPPSLRFEAEIVN